ncbi:MAG: Type 1 glutamine amidotransferase-like domain-containing protein [Chloroflexi bacterium]|nr:Type 1 glutamine amidotransferase-like domain-containing protein [Chloroflexota bacterium]
MAGKIALVGGDEFQVSCRQMDNELVNATGHVQPRVLIVPTATAQEGRPVLQATHGVQQFETLGADAQPLMILSSEEADDKSLASQVDKADIVYFAGGNPAYLLEVLRGSLLLRKVQEGLERNLIVAGSSAGAMVMGERMRFRQWTDALSIVPGVVVLPHHERASKNETARDLRHETTGRLTALGIDGATGCVSDGDGWRVLGEGEVTVYRDGEWSTHTQGEHFEIG